MVYFEPTCVSCSKSCSPTLPVPIIFASNAQLTLLFPKLTCISQHHMYTSPPGILRLTSIPKPKPQSPIVQKFSTPLSVTHPFPRSQSSTSSYSRSTAQSRTSGMPIQTPKVCPNYIPIRLGKTSAQEKIRCWKRDFQHNRNQVAMLIPMSVRSVHPYYF